MKMMIRRLGKKLAKIFGVGEKKKVGSWGRNQIREMARLKGKLILM